MARRWLSLPSVVGMAFLVAGVLFIAVPNWARAQAEYRRGIDLYLGPASGPVDAAVGMTIAVLRTIVVTFAVGVVEHPILTVLFGVGSLLIGVVLVVEYGLLATDEEPWRDEFEM